MSVSECAPGERLYLRPSTNLFLPLHLSLLPPLLLLLVKAARQKSDILLLLLHIDIRTLRARVYTHRRREGRGELDSPLGVVQVSGGGGGGGGGKEGRGGEAG